MGVSDVTVDDGRENVVVGFLVGFGVFFLDEDGGWRARGGWRGWRWSGEDGLGLWTVGRGTQGDEVRDPRLLLLLLQCGTGVGTAGRTNSV